MAQKVEHSLSLSTIFTIVLVGVGAYFIWKLADLLLLVLVALMLAAALNPLVKRVSTVVTLPFAAIIVVFGILLPIIGVVAFSIPELIAQGPGILDSLTNVIRNTSLLPESVRSSVDVAQYAQEVARYLLQSVSTITSLLTAVISLIVLTIYLLIDVKNLKKLALLTAPKSHRIQVEELIRDFAQISGQYIRGNLLISLVCSLIIFIGLIALGVPNAALLAVFAGIMDLLPLVGSFVGAIPAIILAFTVSPLTGVLAIALFLIYQQFENHILAPKIYNKTLKLAPAASFLAVLAGAGLYGIIGAFIALPLAASIPALLEYVREYREQEENPE